MTFIKTKNVYEAKTSGGCALCTNKPPYSDRYSEQQLEARKAKQAPSPCS